MLLKTRIENIKFECHNCIIYVKLNSAKHSIFKTCCDALSSHAHFAVNLFCHVYSFHYGVCIMYF